MRSGTLLGAFTMIAAIATVVATAGQLMATALGASGPGRFAAADAVVRANPTVRFGSGEDVERVEVQRAALLPPSSLARAAAVPGVRSAVGDITFPLTVLGRDGTPLPTRGDAPADGHGWPSAALTPYRLAAGKAPSASTDIVLDAGLARAGGFRVGDLVRVVAPAGTGTYRLTGIAAASPVQEERQSSVFVTQARAQQLSGLGPGFNAIAVRAEPGRDGPRLRERLRNAIGGGAQVLSHRHAAAADAGDPRAFDRVQLVAVVASGGGLTVAISVFVVAGTIMFAVQRRRRELALLRAIGATPGQTRRRLLRETALLGLLAGTAGCLAASALLGPFTDALVRVGIAPDGFTVAPNWIPYLIAVAVGVVVTLLATLIASRRTLALRPGEALIDAALPKRRLGILRMLLGLVALGGGISLVVVLSSEALSYAMLAAFLIMVAVALLGPILIGWPSALAGRILLPGGGPGFLAGSSLAAGRFRAGAVGAAIALVVALGATQVLSLATAQHETEHVSAERVLARHVLVPRAGGGLPPSVAAEAARLPGATATGMVSTNVFLLDHGLTNGSDSWDAVGLDAAATPRTLDLDVRAGSLAEVRGDSVAVSDTLAGDGATVGSVFDARLADGTPAQLHVAAVYHRANGMGDVVLPRQLALAHATAALDSAVFVSGGPGVVHGLDAIADRIPTVSVVSRADYLSQVRAAGLDAARAQWVIVALMIGIAVMAAFNTGAMAATERRRELTLARLVGATRSQMVASLVLESLVTTLVGIAIGLVVTLAALAYHGSDPHGGALVIPWGPAGLVAAAGLALGLVSTLLPAALVARRPASAH
jgi:putative ABC transport system permease protein